MGFGAWGCPQKTTKNGEEKSGPAEKEDSTAEVGLFSNRQLYFDRKRNGDRLWADRLVGRPEEVWCGHSVGFRVPRCLSKKRK